MKKLNAIDVTINNKNNVLLDQDEYNEMMSQLVIESARKTSELYKQGELETLSKDEFIKIMNNKSYVSNPINE